MAGNAKEVVLFFVWILACNRLRGVRRRRRLRVALATIRRRRRRLLFAYLAIQAAMNAATVVRTVGFRDRNTDWWEQDVLQTLSEEQFQANFRMTRATFDFICRELDGTLSRRNLSCKTAISVRKRVGVLLYYLASGCSQRTLSNLFGIGKSTACTLIHEVCDALVGVFKDRYMQFPRGDRLRDNVQDFEDKWGFPQCGGAIDGTHIRILAPPDNHTDYFNRKGYHSIILQAVVDPWYRFTNVNIGWPGSVHDARVLRNSALWRMAEAGDLFPDDTRDINGVPVPVMLVGDPAYPLLSWLIKGFPDTGQLSRDERLFNYRLSRARMVVECAFGRLKGRWRCLLKRLDLHLSSVPTIVYAACLLHNLCEIHGEEFDDEWLRYDNVPRQPLQNANQDAQPAAVRNALSQFFAQQ